MIKSGTVFAGRYEIIERIGSGGMADVYKAHDARLKRDVAIKVLKSSLSEDSNFVEKFRTEGEAAASLTNANVVSVYDVGNVGSTYYIVMELIDGITLKDYIRRKGMLSSRETMAISAQVAVGLRAAHARHIVHRDIKPQNIILSRDGKVKVTDFGIARGVTEETKHGQKAELGSVHYIAPEQAKGQPCDERSDIYSLGIVMYEMITGRVPFDKDTQVAVALAHMNETMIPPSEINPDCPVALEQIIFRATQKSKERRYHNCTELLQDLRIAVANPSFNFEKQEQETVLKSTTQVFTGPAASQRVSSFDKPASGERTPASSKTSASAKSTASDGGTRPRKGTPLFQPNVPAVPGDDVDFDTEPDLPETVSESPARRQAMTIIDSEEKKPKRPGIREHRSAGAVIDFTELSPDQDFDEADTEEQKEENHDLFAEDMREDEKPLMDRIILIAGIVIGAVIICLLIYIFVTLSGCNQNAVTRPTSTSASGTRTTEAPKTETETTTEEFIELSTKETEMFNEETDAIVPNVIGYYYEEAIQRLKDAGLEAKLGSQFGYSDEYPEMYIIKQSYPEGTIVEKGSTIVIMMSQGSDKFEIQEHYVGGTLSAFKNDAVNYPDINFVYENTYSSTTPANHIISIDPSSGLVQPGDTVTVIYSLGPEFVAVPNLYGMYKGDVSTKLMYSALTIGNITEEYSDEVNEGLIMGQSPAPETTVRNGSSVDIVVSLGPKMEQVPGVIGMDVEAATAAMDAVGFTVEIVEEVNAEYPEGTVTLQDPVEGDYWPLRDPIKLTV
ncbi:MAG: protein kinase, partial [Lachnospiraceae bacterium]|nr:protein kinase [Lachnospiraceae bacterium]